MAEQYPNSEVRSQLKQLTFWSIGRANMLPNQVLGIDVSPLMLPEDPPSNLEFQIDDLNGR